MADIVVVFTTNDGTRLKVEHRGKSSDKNQDIREIIKYAFLGINWGTDEYDITDIKSIEVPEMGFQAMLLEEALNFTGLTWDGEKLTT